MAAISTRSRRRARHSKSAAQKLGEKMYAKQQANAAGAEGRERVLLASPQFRR